METVSIWISLILPSIADISQLNSEGRTDVGVNLDCPCYLDSANKIIFPWSFAYPDQIFGMAVVSVLVYHCVAIADSPKSRLRKHVHSSFH